jgi:3-polyprenyl-4-hydroxybenzoate decarboxylase
MLLAAVFTAATVALFRTAELQWIKRNKRLILCDREVPRRAYIFEVAVKTTL